MGEVIISLKVRGEGGWRSEAKVLDGLRGGEESIPGIEREPSMEATTNIYLCPYCKLSNALEELGYK